MIITNEDTNISSRNLSLMNDEYKDISLKKPITVVDLSMYKIYFVAYHATNNELNSPFSNANRLKVVHSRVWCITKKIA